MSAPDPMIRQCRHCGDYFDARGTTTPRSLCSAECKRLRHIEVVRQYRARRSAELANLRQIVAGLQVAA